MAPLALKHAATHGAVSAALLCALLIQGCSPYESRHHNQWNSREQIWLSETSQLKVRAAQTRAFDTTDRRRMFEAVISTMQDLNFTVEVLDEELGIVSGKKFVETEQPYGTDPTYLLYRPDTLLLLTRNFHTWGPFWHRSNLVRFTATIRTRGDSQLIVRASAQFYLQAVEEPGPYQQFFRALEQALFLHSQSVE
jgi:hypothetical protein